MYEPLSAALTIVAVGLCLLWLGAKLERAMQKSRLEVRDGGPIAAEREASGGDRG